VSSAAAAIQSYHVLKILKDYGYKLKHWKLLKRPR
jgi:hypothetical protein